MDRKAWEPELVFGEYESGRNFKAGLGRRGLYEQGKINERFYVGDQWHGAQCGNDRPLVRHNVIKRIGDYKMAVQSRDGQLFGGGCAQHRGDPRPGTGGTGPVCR